MRLTIHGTAYRMLTIIDDYTREALAVIVKLKMGSADVLEALYQLILKRGKPAFTRSDKANSSS